MCKSAHPPDRTKFSDFGAIKALHLNDFMNEPHAPSGALAGACNAVPPPAKLKCGWGLPMHVWKGTKSMSRAEAASHRALPAPSDLSPHRCRRKLTTGTGLVAL